MALYKTVNREMKYLINICEKHGPSPRGREPALGAKKIANCCLKSTTYDPITTGPVKKIKKHWTNHRELHPEGKIAPAGELRAVDHEPRTTNNEPRLVGAGKIFPYLWG